MTIRKVFWTFIFFLSILLAVATTIVAYRYATQEVPNDKRVGIEYYAKDKPLFHRGELADAAAIGEQEGLKLPLAFLQANVDPAIVYEAGSNSVIVTTQDKVLRLRTEGLTSTVNNKPFSLRFAVEQKDDNVYVPLDPLLDLYGLVIQENEQTGIVTVDLAGSAVQWGAVVQEDPKKPVVLRTGASIQEPILSDLAADESVRVWGEKDKWLRVQTAAGLTGYVQKDSVRLDRMETIPAKKEPAKAYVPWKPTGGKINMTWEHVTTKNPDTSTIDAMPGLNVISPTWFHLADGEGNLTNYADPKYVSWAHKQNLQVWALVDNGFDPKRTSEALATYDKRMKIIKQLLSFAQMYKLQGINIDFENVNTSDKQPLIQFVREFTPLAHEQNLVVSIDVTPKSTSEFWSAFLDRRALAETVDYMMLMAYDEHWAASPIAGSVASLPWVEKSLTRLLEEDEVPASKLVLGMPTYTREWTEEQVNGKTKVSSRSIFMSRVERTIKEQNLTPVFDPEAGQNYVEYKEGAAVKKIWIEDAVSIKSRVELAKRYDLAGVASWRRGFESPDIWDAIQSELTRRP